MYLGDVSKKKKASWLVVARSVDHRTGYHSCLFSLEPRASSSTSRCFLLCGSLFTSVSHYNMRITTISHAARGKKKLIAGPRQLSRSLAAKIHVTTNGKEKRLQILTIRISQKCTPPLYAEERYETLALLQRRILDHDLQYAKTAGDVYEQLPNISLRR